MCWRTSSRDENVSREQRRRRRRRRLTGSAGDGILSLTGAHRAEAPCLGT